MLLIGYVLVYAKKYRYYKCYFDVLNDLEKLTNKLRRYYCEFSEAESFETIEFSMQDVLLQSIEVCSRSMTKVTGKECVTSLMMPIESNEEQFQTLLYSSNAPTDRINTDSEPLPLNEGVVGKAFKTLRAQLWCLKNKNDDFIKNRENCEEFYRSGIV